MKNRRKNLSVLAALILCFTLFAPFNVSGQELAVGFIDVSAGKYHSIALKSDGTVWAWGHNDDGQLGDGTKKDKETPQQVVGLTDVKAIACGYDHCLALKKDGTVWGWGNNGEGQLGDGTTSDKETPRATTLTDVKAIACGYRHSLALKEDGSVWAWGDNSDGELGNGLSKDSEVPIIVPDLDDVVKIACGHSHNLAIKSDGTLWSWGSNSEGQIGNGTTKNVKTPEQVLNISHVMDIACGYKHSLAVVDDGSAWAWGNNNNGQLGDGTTSDKEVPVEITGSVNQVACGYKYSMVLKDDGTLLSWGENSEGQLGDGTQEDRENPVQVNHLTEVDTMTCGFEHNLALKKDGTVYVWGSNNQGQLGDGTTTDSTIPMQLVSLNPTNYPQKPSNLQVTPDYGKIHLSWDTADHAVTYHVHRTSPSCVDFILVADQLTSTNYTDNAVDDGVTYTYKITAVNNGLSSPESVEASAMPLNGPAGPTNLAALEGDGQITLSWNPVSHAHTYVIKRGLTSGGPYDLVAEGITHTSYVDTTVTNDTTYYYVVHAVNTDGVVSSNSNQIFAMPHSIVDSRTLLIITFNDGIVDEYDISKEEANAFVSWYHTRAAGTGDPFFKIMNSTNETITYSYHTGNFITVDDYILFDTIIKFRMMDYTVE